MLATTTNMYLIYIDESYDETHFAYSAIFVPAFEWNRVFGDIIGWRKELFLAHRIPLDYELHATNFVGGRGEPNENRNKDYRASIFKSAFQKIESLDGVHIINGITANKKNHLKLFERILNRVNRTLKAKHAYGVLVCDEGNENKLVSIVRSMKKSNLIPSQVNYYESIDIPLERIIEDPLFKTSKSSYFIQLADFVAFGLLRSEKFVDSTRDDVKQAFNCLDTRLVKVAYRGDSRKKGIVRC
jgi:hypothetical protein